MNSYRSPMDAPIVITARRTKRSKPIETHVYPDEVERTTARLAEQGYSIIEVSR